MELSLDLSLVYVPRTISECLRDVSKVKDYSLKLSKLDDYVKKLEDEMKKIDAFKRELPLCMLLLDDAIVRLKEEAKRCEEMESLSPKTDCCREENRDLKNDIIDKKNWMSSVQLWNNNINSLRQDSKSETKQRSEEDDDRSTCEHPIQLYNYRALNGFKAGDKKEEKEVESKVTGLCLMTKESDCCDLIKVQNKPQQRPPHKKQRRCWSPELHRRFLDALQQLGGSQVATPKQIREFIQVDGLTNDEVKSHLQKYRLHICKLPASSAAEANTLWRAQNGHKDGQLKQRVSRSDSPQGPFRRCLSGKGTYIAEGKSTEPKNDDR